MLVEAEDAEGAALLSGLEAFMSAEEAVGGELDPEADEDADIGEEWEGTVESPGPALASGSSEPAEEFSKACVASPLPSCIADTPASATAPGELEPSASSRLATGSPLSLSLIGRIPELSDRRRDVCELKILAGGVGGGLYFPLSGCPLTGSGESSR